MGACAIPGVRSTQELSVGPADAFTFACTSVIVTHTWEYGPSGAEHVDGSLSMTLTCAMPEVVAPEPPLLHATTIPATATRQTIASRGCQIPFHLLF